MNLKIIKILCVLGVFQTSIIQSKQNVCESMETCSQCIQHFDCYWCNDIIDNASQIRCKSIKDINKCTNIENPLSKITVLDSVGQIEPSRIELKLRPQTSQTLKFSFTPPKNYPVDLYFLMDISATMIKHRDELAQLAEELVDTLAKLTPNITMGFGSFVDKTILPFVNTYTNEIKKSCEDCVEPYSFKNHLSLTTNITKFSEEVKMAKLSGNIDIPEGSLDALMQVIVCTKQIGWRENARHLVVLTTDDIFHIAGDGKLAGIVEPNDGLCHLKDNYYTHGLLQDYPSIGQINKKAKEKNIIVIFAVTENVQTMYNKLTENVRNSYRGTLSSNSTIVKLIEEIYLNITYTVQIQHNFDNNFDIKITSTCKDYKKNNSTCKDFKPGEKLSFTAEIKLIKAPADNNFNKIYNINPSGFSENITIFTELLCECDCKKQGEKNAEYCSGVGDFECGICKCPETKIGNRCECDTKDFSYFSDINGCIKENTNETCSGSGFCECGQCICNDGDKLNARERIYGKYCECNDLPCFDTNDIVCSDNGKCNCGVCTCDSEWTGQKCECPKSLDSCMFNGELCSGESYGECVCGKCQCKEVNRHKYSGKYCEQCLTCIQECSDYEDCIKMFGDDEELKCRNYIVQTVETLDDNSYAGYNCSTTKNECLIKFRYKRELDDTVLLYVEKNRNCIENKDIVYKTAQVGIGISIGTLLVATLIALIIYKLFAERKYKIEYAAFLKNKELERNELNPLYKTPKITTTNPLYKSGNFD